MPTNSSIASRQGTARPLYFKSEDDQLFAWLHGPIGPFTSKVGVVICAPFGYESICAHRSIRVFAERISDTGIPAMRFDYSGTGDSAEIDENADNIALWTRDVIAASRELQRLTGVERICLLGVRLGAMLAALAAAECKEIDSLILVGPVVSGRRYVRELRTTQLAGIALSGASGADGDPDSKSTAPKPLEAGGFSLSTATLASLALVDLQATAAPPRVRSMLILDNDKLPSAKRWVESLSNSGVDLHYNVLPGLIEMAMTAPQFAVVPQAMIDTTCEWLTATSMVGTRDNTPDISTGNRLAAAHDSSLPVILTLAEDPQSSQPPIIERPVFILSDTQLFGIVTEPPPDEKRRRAVILLNPGADFHIGASRMYVALARRWARRGYFVVRLDFAGIGDSATRAGKTDDEVFPDKAMDDIRSTIEFIESRYAIKDVTIAGLCSGAYHALRAAAAGLDITRILMVNPQNYFWKRGMTLGQIQLVEVVHNPGLYRRRALSARAWLRILKGEVNVMRIAGIYLQRLRLAGEIVLREIARSLRIRLPNDLGRDLQSIVANGIRVTLVFARGEPGIDLLKVQAGSTLLRLGDRFRVRLIDGGDHIFSRRAARSLMENVLSEELYARVDGAGATPDSRKPTALRQISTK